MSDDTSITDGRDSSRVSAREDYEVRVFAQEAGLSLDQARDLVEEFGNDREMLLKRAANIQKTPTR